MLSQRYSVAAIDTAWGPAVYPLHVFYPHLIPGGRLRGSVARIGTTRMLNA